jgi:hypothetical protein
MRGVFVCLAALAMLTLPACGGGSDATSSSTPTPTPTPSYQSAADFTRDRSFTAFGVNVAGRSERGETVRLVSIDQQSSAIGFDFVAATRSYTLRYRDATLSVKSAAVPTDGKIGYGRDVFSDDKIDFVRSGFANNLLYTGYVFWGAAEGDGVVRRHRLIFGARTVASDLPSSGSVSYQAAIVQTGLFNYPDLLERYGSDRFPATVTVNWADRTVSADFSVTRQGIGSSGSSFQPPIDMTLRGTIDGSGRITGTLNPKGGTGGVIEGAVFGPRGVEIGIVTASDGTPGNFADVGILIGRQ